MPYDALGNYIPGDDEPSLDEMRLALMQKSQPSYAQIPTQGYPQAPAPQRPLDTATQTLQQVATKYNPLMLMKSMREGVGSTVVNPVVAGLQGVATELQQPEFWQAGRTQPTGIAERVATDFMQRNAPTTPMAQEFTEAVGKYTQDLPAYLGHLSTNRPVLTPNDIRVMGAEATRLGRQIRDIPSDFANAQAGVQRIDPITGQPTMGTKLQAGAESIGDLMERRRMQGLAPIPGLPETMVPETAMYAVRPAGSRIALPQVPGTKSLTDVPLNRAPYSVLADIVEDPKQPLPPEQVERVFENIRIQKNINSDAFNEWSLRKMQELYPDAPTPQDAIDAWGNQFSNRDARANAMLQWYDEFLASPEGQASPMAQLPSSDEIQARHKAASEWLYGPWLNYINKHVGTSGDPALKLASQGLTYSPAAVVKESVRELVDTEELAKLRKKAGMPALGEVGPKLQEKLKELSAAEADLAKWQTRREAYRDIAMRQGLEDPAQLPDFAATTVPIEKLVRDISKLEEDVGNLRLGANYEALADTAISVRTQPEALARLDYADRQFYPSITRARPEDLIYGIPGTGRLQNLGLDRLAHDVYDNVMSGKIPKEQLPKLSIDKIIREEAIPRIKKEKAEALLQKEYKTNAERVMAQTLADNAPPENYFGNIGVIELSQKSGLDLDQMTKILSQATTVLDHCIAQGGSAGSNVNNLWHPQHKRTYEPIYDVVTGERNPRAQRDVSSYATGVVKGGDMIADIRDRNTGVPIATLELSKSHDDADGTTKYHIGWASGARNRDVDPKYADSIKEYLNSRSDMIYSAGTNLLAHTGIHDTRNTAAADMGRAAGVTTEQVRAIDFSSLPRFATKEDIKAYADGVMQAQQVTEAQAPARPGFSPTQVMRDVESAIDNAMDFALTNYDEETTNFVGQVIRDRLSTARLVSLSDPVAAQEYLDSAITELYDWSNNSQMSNSVRRQDTAQAIYNLIPDLEGIRSAIGRRVYEATAEAAAAAPQAEGIPLSNARMFDNFIDSVRRDVSTQVGDRVETVAHRISINLTPGGTVASAMRNRPAQFAQALREAGVNEDSELVEVSLNELADLVSDPTRAVQPAAQPEPAAQAAQAAQAAPAPFTTQDFSDWVQLVNTNLGFTEADRLVRVANRITTDIGAGTVGQALENNPTAFADALASAAREPGNEAISRALSDLADRIAPPVRDVNEPLPELNFEPDVGHPANQPTDIAAATDNQLVRNIEPGRFTEVNRMIDMAIADAQAVGVGPEEAYDTVSRGGVANIQGTPYELEYIARNVRAGLEFAEQQRQNQQRPQLNIDDIAFELFNDTRRGDDPNSPRNLEDLRTTLQALETGNFDDMRFRGYTPAEQNVMQSRVARAIREIMDDIGVTLPAEPQQPQIAPYRPIADAVGDMTIAELRNVLDPNAMGEVAAVAEDILRFNTDPTELQTIADMVHNHRMSAWEAFSDEQRALLSMRLHSAASELLRNQEPPNTPPPGYQAGGSVKYPGFFGARDEAIERSEEMYGAHRQDDAGDAARHMLASGYMAQSLGPTVAKGLGWLHEFKEAPIRTAGHALGLSNPRYDYEMDMHNNALGIEMAQKAKNRTDFEQMVKDSIAKGTTATTPGRVRLMTPEQAEAGRGKLKYANGGTVSQTPSLDAMKYELMMRSK